MSRYSLKEVIELYRGGKSEQEKKVYISYYFIRPISYIPSVILANLGLTANATTWIGFSIGLGSMGLFWFGGKSLLLFAWLSYFLFHIFDHIDGNIARLQRKTTYYGKYIDSITEKTIDGFLDFCLACGMASQFGINSRVFVLVGSLSSLIYFMTFILNIRFLQLENEYKSCDENDLEYSRTVQKDTTHAEKVKKNKLLLGLYSVIKFVDVNCMLVLLLIFILFNCLFFYLILSLIVRISDFFACFLYRVVLGKEALMRHRAH